MPDPSKSGQWVLCPACHQRAGMISDAATNTYECEQCGHTWRETTDSSDDGTPGKKPRNDRSTPRIFN